MKSQLKSLVSENIFALELHLENVRSSITYYYSECDKADDSQDSKNSFYNLNKAKIEKRKLDSQLKRLRALQVEIKKMVSYTTKKSTTTLIHGKDQHVLIFSTKEF